MLSTWLYNLIEHSRKREAQPMNFDFVMDKIGNGGHFNLMSDHPKSVSIKTNADFYIKPTLLDTQLDNNSKLILFSAPGATGKSALAKYISYTKKALLWDLSMEKIANHSYSGMLVKALGTKEFSNFTEGLLTGDAVLVIDALDEAEMISGRAAVETLLMDLRTAAMGSVCPNIILCARTETAHFIKKFYSQPEHKLELSQFEVSFFEESNAIEFIKKKIEESRPITSVTIDCIKELFNEIKRLLDNDTEAINSFIGYAPVLEALATFYTEENNTMQLVQKIKSASCSAEIFLKIMEHILIREHRKVVNGFKERCEAEYPDFTNWNDVYSIQEQLVRLINYVLFDEIDDDIFPNDSLPRELKQEYIECVNSFLKDHPFIHTFESDDRPIIDFTGPAFRDYVLAQLMTDKQIGSDCDDYAQCYFSDHGQSVRFPSQLYFDLYEHCSDRTMQLSHFQYLYDAFKAKERTKFASAISVEQVENDIYCTFKQDTFTKKNNIHEADFHVISNDQPLLIHQLNNGYIDLDSDIILGSPNEDVILCNSTIKCNRLIIQSPNIMLIAETGGELLIVSKQGIDSSRCPTAKFELRVDDDRLLKISSPNINDWYKLHKYEYCLDDNASLDITRFENAVRAILKHFRKHSKDAPGKYRDYIDNIIVGGSHLKKDILEFFIGRGIIYQDSKDLRQYKLNNSALEALGINWGMMTSNNMSNMHKVFHSYNEWKQFQQE